GFALLVDQARGHAFERGPAGDHPHPPPLRLAPHVAPPPRHRADKSFALELRHGLATRRAADAEVDRQFAFVEADFAGGAVNVHGRDRVFQRGVGTALEALDGRDRLNPRGLHRSRCHPWGLCGGKTARCATGAAHYGYTIIAGIQYARALGGAIPSPIGIDVPGSPAILRTVRRVT